MKDNKITFKTEYNTKLILKWYAHKKGKTLKDVLNEAIDEYVEKYDIKEFYEKGGENV